MGAVLYLGGKSTLTHIELSNTYADAPVALYCYPGSLVERVVASASGKGSTGATMHSECVIRDSLLTSSGENSVALNGVGFFMGNQHGSAVNDTIIASGPGSVGARSYWLPGGPGEVGTFELIVQDAIAQGNAADLEATTTATSLGLITVSNSNFDSKKESPGATVTNAGGNQSAAPLFVNAEGGNYREAAGSPTIDAGSANPLAGTLDLADNARTQGAAIDIGAYELVPPPIPPVIPVLTGQLQSLSLAPSAFVPANVGGAVLSGARKKPPVTTRVAYSISASAAVAFSVERRTTGRRVGRKCVKRTKANASKKRCPLYRKVRGGFSVNSATGSNHFVFTGRIGNKALSPGRYRLSGSAGGVTKTAKFRILK